MDRKRRIAVYALSGLAVLYLATVSTLWAWARHRQGNTALTYADLLLPQQWHQFRSSQGRMQIRQAQALMASGQIAAAYRRVRTGLARAPADRPGRLLLAQLYADNQRGDMTKQLLLDGMQYHASDPEYARIVIGYLDSVQADDEIIRLNERLQQSPATQASVGAIFHLGAATAAFHRGHHDGAENILAAAGLQRTRDGRLLGAKIQWERGYGELALHQLRALADDVPGDEEVYAQLSAWLRECDQFDESRQRTLVFQLARPDSILPRIDRLRDHVRERNEAALQQSTTEILRLFPRDERILLALGDFAATTGQPALAREVHARLPARSPGGQSASLLELEALIVAREYGAALAKADELERLEPPLAGHLLNLCQGLRAIAHYGSRDPESGRLALNRFLAGTKLRAGNLLAIANRLMEVEARPPAKDLLARATLAEPMNQPVLSRLIELDLELDDIEALPARLQRLLAMRKPSRDLLNRVSITLGSDRCLFFRERTATLNAIGQHLETNQTAATRH